MPLVDYSLKVIANLLPMIAKDTRRTGNVLTLSYPDVVAAPQTVTDIFGKRVRNVAIREDSAQTVRWHKAAGITSEIVDTKALFAALGYAMTAFDVTAGRGGEILHDLSNALPTKEHDNKYDLVFDCITNQCFNVAEAWRTMLRCCRVGGYIVSVTPVQMVNQGFWNISPTAYHDFAAANRCSISHRAIVGVYTAKNELTLDSMLRQREVPDDTMNVVTLQKLEATPDVVWPIMKKFQLYPTSHLPPVN